MHRLLLSTLVAVLAMGGGSIHAQNTTPSSDSARLSKLETELDKLKSIRISGYIQTEWQHFDQSDNHGARALFFDSRKNFFTIRRGRIKFQHRLNDVMSYTLQPDITESGVRLKDAFATFNLLSKNAFAIQVGAFNRPNYEVELSSSTRESAERSQVVRAFYPDERDLGVMFSSRIPAADQFKPNLQLGIFNGGGVTPEIDPYKDIIARLTFPLPLGDKSPIQIDLGGSVYYGGIPQRGDTIRQVVDGAMKRVPNPEDGSAPGWGNKQNINVESQISLDLLPVGRTMLKGEFLSGKRPTAAVTDKPLELRDQMGIYAYFIQNFGGSAQIAVKYDLFDRNTGLSGTEVLSAADALSAILGFGGSIFVDNMRITLWYEIPSFAANENVVRDSTNTIIDDADVKDNKTTIRFQYRF